MAGLAIGWIYHRFGKEAAKGNNLILEEIHDPKNVVPLRMAALILGGTLLTHLFGGSAGREGTAVQMGAALSDQLSRYFKIATDERKILLVAGAGAGFGAAIGAPWAGVIFGMEVIHVGRLKLFAWIECLIASWTGYSVAILLGAKHLSVPSVEIPGIDAKTLFFVALAGSVFGLTARIFSLITHFVERTAARYITFPPLIPLCGGLLISVLFYLEGSYEFAGLGLSYIQEALIHQAHLREPVLKALFTSLTLGMGFKGGEFVPLVFIGATLGSVLGMILPVAFSTLAAVGFAAVFAGASNTPIACTIMAMELFGPKIGPYAAVACFVSYNCSGTHGIYKSQKAEKPKLF